MSDHERGNGFVGRVAIVTGGSGGIGSSICAALAARGAAVASLSADDADNATLSLRCDITDERRVADAAATVERDLGTPSLLVCAAGVVDEQALTEMSLKGWQRVTDVSLTGTFLAVRHVVPAMIAARRGKIVALSSGYARKGYARGAHYAAAKGGVEALVKSLALEVAADGITVNAVAPGPVDTAMFDHARARPEVMERITASIPMGRIAQPDDVVGPVLFLLSPASDYVTGQVLHVNGGLLMP